MDTAEQRIIDEFTDRIEGLWARHPLWERVLPPRTLGVVVHPSYRARLMAANQEAFLFQEGRSDRGVPYFDMPLGRLYVHGANLHKRPGFGKRAIRLLLRPDEVHIPRHLLWPESAHVVVTRPVHFADKHPVQCRRWKDEDGRRWHSTIGAYPREAGIVKLWNQPPLVSSRLKNSLGDRAYDASKRGETHRPYRCTL